jgi:hypothetical protein
LTLTIDATSILNHLWVAAFIHPNDKSLNVPLITSLFNTNNANKIISTTLFSLVSEDKQLWRVKQHEHYSIKSTYRLCTQELIDTSLISFKIGSVASNLEASNSSKG